MQQTIYIVYSFTLDGINNICALTSELNAKALVKQLKALMLFNKLFAKTTLASYKKSYEETKPKPEASARPAPSKRFRELQELLANKQGSEKDKIEFAKEQAAHLQNIEEFRQKEILYLDQLKIWNQLENQDLELWFSKNYNPPDELKPAVPFFSKSIKDFERSASPYYNPNYSFCSIELYHG